MEVNRGDGERHSGDKIDSRRQMGNKQCRPDGVGRNQERLFRGIWEQSEGARGMMNGSNMNKNWPANR